MAKKLAGKDIYLGGVYIKRLKMMSKPAILNTLIFCLVSLIVLSFVIMKMSDENHKEILDRDTEIILKDINNVAFSNLDAVARALASDSFVKEVCINSNNLNYDKTIIVLNTAKKTSSIDVCYVMNLNGIVIASSEYELDKNLKIEGQDFSFRPYFIKAIEGKESIYPALGATTKVRGVYFSSPVRDKDKKVIGVVTCKIGMEAIDNILKEYTYKLLVSTNEGIVFSTNIDEWLYRSVLPISEEKLDDIVKSKQFSDVSIKPLELLVKNDNAMLDNKRKYASEKEIGATDWKLLALSDLKAIPLVTPMQALFIGTIFLILLALMIVIVILKNDILKRRESELKLKKLFHAVEQCSSIIVITDTKGIIEYVNPKFTELTGYTIEESIGRNTSILKSGEHDDEFYKKIWATIESGEDWRGNFCNKRKDGNIYWEDSHISSVRNSKGDITSFIAVKEDITKRREIEEKLNMYATMDEMTGTFNRRSCMLLMEKQLQISKEQVQNFVIFFMDINGLKSVNDSLGHNFGDELIISAVTTIKTCLRKSDFICRLGGDEFLVIMPNTNLLQAELLLNRIEDAVKELNSKEKYSFILSLSFGTAEYLPESNLMIDDMIQIADEKMYKNKAEIKQNQGTKGIFRNG